MTFTWNKSRQGLLQQLARRRFGVALRQQQQISSLASRCSRRWLSSSYSVPVVRESLFASSASFSRHHSTSAAPKVKGDNSSSKPELKHIPSFPLVGSTVPQLSGIPDTIFQPYAFWPELRRRYGDFYTIGIPGIGKAGDIRGTLHVVTDPREYVPIIKAGGSYPSGLVETMWVSQKWMAGRDDIHTKGLFENGPEWKRLRNFMQTDLLHPDAARGYVPGLVKAAQLASKGAKAAAESTKEDGGALNGYLARCSFDMFSTVMFGELTEVADPTTPTDPINEEFVTNTTLGLSSSINMLFSPYESFLNNTLGMTTKQCQTCLDAFDVTWVIGQDKIESFMQRKANGTLSDRERNSYLYRALDRQQEPDSQVTVKEAQEMASSGLFAAVDTTSSVLGWNLFHLARCPEVQERLHQELVVSVQKVGGEQRELSVEALSRKQVPYLHAVIRETQRISPAAVLYILKRIDAEDGVVVNNVLLSKGEQIALDGYSIGMDPDFVENPESFRPERWLPQAVEARKGTPQEVIDHPFLKEPFSQGMFLKTVLVFCRAIAQRLFFACPCIQKKNNRPNRFSSACL